MATYTSNYQLHQWVPEDDFLRTDFNTDFQKIDAGIKAARDLAASKDAWVEGSYAGDGTETRVINLGFQPRAVVIDNDRGDRSSGTTGGVFLRNKPLSNAAEITATGFTIHYRSNTSINDNGWLHCYVALK